jgi:hypothetical protein
MKMEERRQQNRQRRLVRTCAHEKWAWPAPEAPWARRLTTDPWLVEHGGNRTAISGHPPAALASLGMSVRAGPPATGHHPFLPLTGGARAVDPGGAHGPWAPQREDHTLLFDDNHPTNPYYFVCTAPHRVNRVQCTGHSRACSFLV